MFIIVCDCSNSQAALLWLLLLIIENELEIESITSAAMFYCISWIGHRGIHCIILYPFLSTLNII